MPSGVLICNPLSVVTPMSTETIAFKTVWHTRQEIVYPCQFDTVLSVTIDNVVNTVNTSYTQTWSQNTMSKDHDKPWINYGFIRHVLIFKVHHHHCLLPWIFLRDVALLLPPVQLPRLQGTQASRPAPYVPYSQFRGDMWRTVVVQQSPLDDVLQDGVRCGDDAAPSGDTGCWQAAHPPQIALVFRKSRKLLDMCIIDPRRPN